MKLVLLIKSKQKGHKQYTKIVGGKTVVVKQKGIVSQEKQADPRVKTLIKEAKMTQAEAIAHIKQIKDINDKLHKINKDITINPYADPKTIKVNKEIAKWDNKKLAAKILKLDPKSDEYRKLALTPCATWIDVRTGKPDKLQRSGQTIGKAKLKTDEIYSSLEKYAEGYEKIEKIYLKDSVETKEGIFALMNVLARKSSFRLGNWKSAAGKSSKNNNNPTYGVMTFKINHVYENSDGSISFRFKGKKGENWNKKIKPDSDLNKKIIQDIKDLKAEAEEYDEDLLFGGFSETEVNAFMKKQFGDNTVHFHNWRTYNASLIIRDAIANPTPTMKKIAKMKDDKKRYKAAKKAIDGIIETISDELTNTPAIAKKSYISHGAQHNLWKMFKFKMNPTTMTGEKPWLEDK